MPLDGGPAPGALAVMGYATYADGSKITGITGDDETVVNIGAAQQAAGYKKYLTGSYTFKAVNNSGRARGGATFRY